MEIVIVNYGLGNLLSINNMVDKIGYNCIISDDINTINKADKLILSGVGHFNKGMRLLNEKKLIDTLNHKVLHLKTPILGICLGMQLMTQNSQEAQSVKGLSWIEAKTIKFQSNNKRLKIPHMGWSEVNFINNSELCLLYNEQPRFYFTHSYKVVCQNEEDVFAKSNYINDFHSAFKKENIWGVQFHPEKSHKFGMKFLNHFLNHNH
jgi:imidazole glycerol-phosphate synthase subunit HisH